MPGKITKTYLLLRKERGGHRHRIRNPRLLMGFLRFLPIRTKRVIEGRSEGATP